MKKMLYLFFCGGKRSGLVCRVDGPSVSEVNHVVFTDKTGRKDNGNSEKYNNLFIHAHICINISFMTEVLSFKKVSSALKIPVNFEIVYFLSAALFI